MSFTPSSLTPSRAAPAPPSSRPQHNDAFHPPHNSSPYNNQQQNHSPASSQSTLQGAGGGSYNGTLRPIVSPASGLFPPPSAGGGAGGSSVIRRGYVNVKEDGLRSWIWAKKWLALRETTLTFHKNEVSSTKERLSKQRGQLGLEGTRERGRLIGSEVEIQNEDWIRAYSRNDLVSK